MIPCVVCLAAEAHTPAVVVEGGRPLCAEHYRNALAFVEPVLHTDGEEGPNGEECRIDRERLAGLLRDAFPKAERGRWPFTVEELVNAVADAYDADAS